MENRRRLPGRARHQHIRVRVGLVLRFLLVLTDVDACLSGKHELGGPNSGSCASDSRLSMVYGRKRAVPYPLG